MIEPGAGVADSYLNVTPPGFGKVHVRRDLLDSFQGAIRAYTALQRTPAWRPWRRRALEAELERLAARADRRRLELGGRPGEPGLIALIIASDVALNGARALTRGRLLR